MTKVETFERILASLHEVALDPARWSSASALMDEALGVHGSTMLFGDGDTEEDSRIYFAWTYYRGERQAELERLYFETLYALDERRPRMRHAPDSRLFHITDLYTEEELKNSAVYDALRTRAHAGNAIDVRLDGPNRSRIIWEINDPVDGDGWSSAQLDSIRRLLPHIRQTVRVQQTLAGAGALGATLTELLDGLFDADGLLFARAPQDDDALQALLARALPQFGGRGAGGSTTARRPEGLPPLVLHVNPVGGRETDLGAWPVAALVLVVDPVRGGCVNPDVASDALGLTRMESRVAVLLARGMSVADIAAATGRQESTIRSHVKHMFTKHGLTRQADLVRLVLSLAGAVDARR